MRVVLNVLGATLCAGQPGQGQPQGGNQQGGNSGNSGSSSKCNECGADTTYSEQLLSASVNGVTVTKRTITANGCPNHYSICTGKDGPPGCAAIGVEGTDTEAEPQDHVIDIPAYPVIATSTTSNECELGIAAISLNGVSIFNGAVNQQCELVVTTDATSEWTSFDMCSGHSASPSGTTNGNGTCVSPCFARYALSAESTMSKRFDVAGAFAFCHSNPRRVRTSTRSAVSAPSVSRAWIERARSATTRAPRGSP